MSNFPSVRPSLNLQFDSQPTPADMTSHLASVGATFSRASIGTYTDANGVIQEATAGQARPNYSTAGVHEGLLIEEARTNKVVNSENFNVYSAIYQTTISAGLEIAPNGKGNSTLVSNTTDNDIHGFAIGDGGITSGVVYTLSLFVKKGSSRYLKLKSNNTTTLAIDVIFDLNDGSVDTELFGTGSSQSFSNGWYRLSVTGTCGVTGSTSVGIRILNDSKQETYTGVTTENIYVWGFQFEQGSFPTSYIPTIPTFSDRDSVATFLGSDGLIQTASVDVARSDTYVYVDNVLTEAGLLLEGSAENLIASSEDFSVTDWNKARSSIIVNQAIAPDGTASADKLVESTDTNSHLVYQNVTYTSGVKYTQTVFLKKAEQNFATLFFSSGQGFNANYGLGINLTTGETTVTSGLEFSVEDVGNGWFKCSITETTNATSGRSAYIVVQESLTDSLVSYAGDGTSGIYIWGAQLEEGSFPTSYFPTEHSFTSRASSATFFNASGVLSTASTNVARTDHKYIGGEWVEAGLLLEGASTNLVTNSEDLSGYTNFGSTDTASATTSPDNASNGTKIEGDGTQPQVYLATPAITLPSAGDYTISVFAKAGNEDTIQVFFNGFDISSGGGSYFDLTNGTLSSSAPENARIEDVGNGWYKCSVTATVGSGDLTGLFSFRVTPSTSAFLYGSNALANGKNAYVYGFQLEAGTQPTSYIATTGSTATRSADVSSAKSSVDRTRDADSYTTATKTRSADVCYIDGTAFTDFYNQEQGTFFVFWEGFTDGGSDRWIGVHDSSKASVTDDRIIFAFSTNAESIRLFIADDGVVQSASINDTNVAQTTANKYALAVKLNDVNSYQDGIQVVSDSGVTMPSADKLVFNNGGGASPFQGYIRKLIYFPRRLSNNELIKLTQ